jgi:hypothetical protein
MKHPSPSVDTLTSLTCHSFAIAFFNAFNAVHDTTNYLLKLYLKYFERLTVEM